MLRFKSIVSRILWVHIIAVAVTATTVFFGIHIVLRSTAEEFQNRALSEHADIIAGYLKPDSAGGLMLDLPADLRTLYAHNYSGFAFAVVDNTGRALYASGSSKEALAPLDLHQKLPSYFQNIMRKPLYYGATIPKQVEGHRVWIQVAQDLEHPDAIVDDIVDDFLGKVGWITIPIMLILVAIDIVVVSRALLPVVDVSRMAGAIDPARMDVRLPTNDLPREIQPLVDAVNQALDRLEAGFRVQREFTADAAHELRTPLSVLRARIDTLADKELARALRADLEAMTNIVVQLLEIAELEDVSLDRNEIVDLRDICIDVAALIAPLALEQSKEVALVGVDAPVPVKGNRSTLFRAIRNLAENALEHTPSESTVELEVGAKGIVRVLDKGPGVPEAERELIFRRFWRRDRRQSGKAGLGLSIVSKIADLHGGSVSVENRLLGGAVFALRLIPVQPTGLSG